MSDLIDRQQAIDVLEEQLDYLFMLNKKDNPTAKSKWYGVNWARNTIAELPSVKPKWIPVEERLPENSGSYLVTVQNGNVYSATFDACSKKFYCKATAWMPLPEAYKKDEYDI